VKIEQKSGRKSVFFSPIFLRFSNIISRAKTPVGLHFTAIYYTIIGNIYIYDNGKPVEKQGRKATNLRLNARIVGLQTS
jgi:hypothetical protein